MTIVLLTAGVLGIAGGKTETVSTRASINYLEGQVTVDAGAAEIGDPVPLGATVKTGAQSLGEILFNVKNLLRLSENTTLVFNPGNLQAGSELKQGALVLILKKLTVGANGRGFVVRTPGAVAGVRGTSFFIKAMDDHTTYVCSCNGAIQIADASGRTVKDFEAPHHKAYLFSTSGGSVNVTDSTLLYHTDADMEQAAAKIGVTIDWNTVDR
jgi:hypothetical protein